MKISSPRHPVAVVLAISLALTWAVWFPKAQSEAFPDTVGQQVDVALTALLPSGSRQPMVLAPGGVLRAQRDTVTPPVTVCSEIWFTAVAITWIQPGRAQIVASIRVSEDGNTFSSREQLSSEPDHQPDRGTDEYVVGQKGTPLLWTGGSKCARFSMKVPAGTDVSDVRVVFINSSGSADGPGTAPPSPLQPESASAMTRTPQIITRDDWGAPKEPECGPYYADRVKMAFVHHTDGVNRYPKSASDDILRGILWYHVRGLHWCDIAYNFLIDRYGRTFEGRAGGMEEPVISGATQGVNTGSASVALMGSHSHTSPTKQAISALKRLLAWRLDVAHVPPNVKTTMTSLGGDNTWLNKGQSTRLNTISGHRDTGYTDCPGNRLYRKLWRIRRAVAGMGRPKIYYPTVTKQLDALGEPTWRFVARGSTTLDWKVEVTDLGGTLVRTFTRDDAQRLRTLWDGRDEGDLEVPPGSYTVTISGNHTSRQARPAVLYVKIKAAPSPSPSPSPSILPSPSP